MFVSVKFTVVSVAVFCTLFGFLSAYLLKPHIGLNEPRHQLGRVDKMLKRSDEPESEKMISKQLAPQLKAPAKTRDGLFPVLAEVDLKLDKPVAVMSTLYGLVDKLCLTIIQAGFRAVYKDRIDEDLMEQVDEIVDDDFCRSLRL